MSNSPWCGSEGDKLYLQSGQFSSTMKTSRAIGGIHAIIQDIAWDGMNTPWCGADGSTDELYLQSGQFSATIKTSLVVDNDYGLSGITWDGTNTPVITAGTDKFYLLSGQFSSTIKTSLTTGVPSAGSLSWDGTNTPWCGAGSQKLYLQSGQFSATIKTSILVGSPTPTGISYDGINTLWTDYYGKLYLQSGQFSSTIKDSLDVTGIDIQVRGISTNDINGRLGIIPGEVELAGISAATSSASGSLSVSTPLTGSSAVISSATGALNISIELQGLQGSLVATSGASGVLSIATELQGFSAVTSGVSGRLFSADELRGNSAATSGASGVLSIATELQGSSAATSGTSGSLYIDVIKIEGYSAAISDITGSLNSQPGLVGDVVAGVSTVGQAAIAINLSGSIAGISAVYVSTLNFPMGFYESLINQITAHFQDIADVNNLIVRYENDPRSTPTSGLWCNCSVGFGDAEQNELGIASFRHIGSFIVEIKNSIGLGTNELLQTADIIASAFRTTDLNRIIFNVPRVRNVGRVDDNHQVDVICSFFSDKIGR